MTAGRIFAVIGSLLMILIGVVLWILWRGTTDALIFWASMAFLAGGVGLLLVVVTLRKKPPATWDE